jgi:hypothetical protein
MIISKLNPPGVRYLAKEMLAKHNSVHEAGADNVIVLRFALSTSQYKWHIAAKNYADNII